MATSRRLRLLGSGMAAALLLTLALPAPSALAQSVSGTLVEFDGEDDGEVTSIRLSLAPDRVRMDMAEFSMVSIGGDDGKMIMMMHERKQYMEFTAEMMASMAAMMGQMPRVEQEIADAAPPTFTRTGNTKQVGEWAAYEVLVEQPDQTGDMIMWFSQDVGADFRTLAQQVIESMSSLLGNPMMQGMTGGGGGGNFMEKIEAQLSGADMPDGFPVQIINDVGSGQESTSTLKAIDQNATFDAVTWEAPAGYTKMAMPFGR